MSKTKKIHNIWHTLGKNETQKSCQNLVPVASSAFVYKTMSI